MDCRMTRGVYLRANGEINCYCSTGEQVTLDHLPLDRTDWDFVADHYLRGRFGHIRESFATDRVPFPDQCAKCNYLDPAGTFAPDKVESEIEWAHIEPCAVCNLRCPFCVHGVPLEKRTWSRPKPHILPRALYSKMLDDLSAKGMNIRWMYFSGRGEPGLHPELWEMVAEAKAKMRTNFLVNTNGNIPFDPRIVESGLDKIKIALDSHYPETYARYRKGGDVNKLLELTRRIAEHKRKTGSKTPQIIWQKVLFDYNDSPEEVAAYQRLALECGVDRIRMCYTYTSGFSHSDPKDLEHIFPAIDILNNRDRLDVPADLLARAAAPDCSLADRFAVISRLYHWFDLGLQNREEYDDFATLALDDEKLYRGRMDDPDFARRMGLLAEQFAALAAIYGGRGKTAEVARYERYAQAVRKLAGNGPDRSAHATTKQAGNG